MRGGFLEMHTAHGRLMGLPERHLTEYLLIHIVKQLGHRDSLPIFGKTC